MNKKIKKHVRVGDRIKVITGKQKGFIGNILSILKNKNSVIIDSIPTRIKLTKNNEKGESKQIEKSIPIHISNVMLWDSELNKASRIGYKITGTEKKRFFKKSGNLV